MQVGPITQDYLKITFKSELQNVVKEKHWKKSMHPTLSANNQSLLKKKKEKKR